MPGIAGIFAAAPSPRYEHQVRRMVATLRHSAASAGDVILAADLGVYAGWVAHEGSYAARQCASHASKNVRLALAGECVGTDRSIVEQYAGAGDGFVSALNGLFAGLLIDRERRHALLFNDRFGSERLYTCEHEDALYFASEAKALLAVLPSLRAFDDRGVAQYLAFGSTLHGQTLFRGVQLVPGASRWRFAAGAPLQRESYFTPSQWEVLPTLSEDEFAGRLSDLFGGVVRDHLIGAQAVGLSLTGGLDTRMIAACLPRDTRPALAYTYAAEGGDRLLDLTIARRVAASCGIPHQALRIGADFVDRFAQHLDRTVWISDGTAGVLGAHELPLTEQASALAPVRLTGNFGSEVLRSMTTFKRSGPSDDLLDPALAAQVGAVVAEERARTNHPVTHAAFEEVPWHLFGPLAVARSQLTVRTPFLDNRVVELAYRAPPASRSSAAASLRLIHDHDPGLAAVPTDRGVSWNPVGLMSRGRQLAAQVTFKLDYWHKDGLPDALSLLDAPLDLLSRLGGLGAHKFLAYRNWFRGALAQHAAQVISHERVRGMPFWSTSALRTLVQDHAGGRRNRLRDIHAVLTLEAVQRLLIDGRAYQHGADPALLGDPLR